MTVADRIDDKLAWVRDRAARALANVQISVPSRSVIEQISSPVISQQAPAPVLPTAPKPRATKEASFLALSQMGLLGLKSSADDIYLVVAAACRAGVHDLTRREIRNLAEHRFERRIDDSWISARVFTLVDSGRVLERPDNRVCTVTGNMVGAVYVVSKQVRLVY